MSIPSNIAEGKGRTGRAEFLHFLSVAHGSLCEVETQFFIAHDLEYMDEQTLNDVMAQAGELGRVLRALMHRVRTA